MSRLELIATAAFGLEAVVGRELADLGYTQQQVEDGRVTFVGGELAICRTNLWLRTADRVLIKVGQFPARDFGQLFDATTALPWDQWLPVDARFPVSGRSVRSLLQSVPALQSVVKKAIVERLKRKYARHWFQETGPEYPIEVSVLRDVVTLTIDTTGPGLHKRGYRRLTGPAPLRETTAAALVLLSYWKPDRPFWDPFCGSGTIPIEAALIGRRRAPGLNRNFLCETWGQISREHWKMAREEARDLQRGKPAVQLIGSDIDPRAIQLATEHAHEAGVWGDIQFRTLDVLEMKSQREYGVIICNPPYGERLGDAASAEAIYDDMADAFAPLKTWSIYVLTAHPDFERHFRRRADRRRKLYNGRIECTYYQFFGPPPPPAVSPEPADSPAETAPPETPR
uniref:Class I SAM-dependent RNA methyltransferase n=1 Tax=Schlesneria paludicola TaxID=360056 RepID=A0A7C4QW54_9PLAN